MREEEENKGSKFNNVMTTLCPSDLIGKKSIKIKAKINL